MVHHVSNLRSFLRTLRRRKVLIVLVAALVPAAAVGASLQQGELYEASSDVFLSRQNLANSLTGTPDPLLSQQPDRITQTQAYLAAEPALAARVVEAADLGSVMTPQELLNKSSVTPKPNGDLLVFRVRESSPGLAQRLATEYARQFSVYRQELDTEALKNARGEVERELANLRSRGQAGGALYASLAEKRHLLRTMEALQTSNAAVVREADNASKIQPRPVRNGILALMLGLMLALGLAFLRDALDTKVRTVEEMAHHLGLPLLGRVPEPPRTVRGQRLVMLRKPGSQPAEAFRMLRTNLQFATLERDVRTIMITSSVEQEGKSTTVANLAVALAATGKRVILVDLDLRRPALSRLFDLGDGPGLTDVALGRVALSDALKHVYVSQPKKKKYSLKRNGNDNDHENGHENENGNGNGNGDYGRPQAFLEVLPAGPPPPDLGEFAGTQALADIIWDLRERADIVLVDAPPMLSVGDALALTSRMDAVLVVARLHRVRRPMLTELARLLDTAPAAKLGFVATGTGAESGYGYEGSVYYGPHARTHEHVA